MFSAFIESSFGSLIRSCDVVGVARPDRDIPALSDGDFRGPLTFEFILGVDGFEP